MKPNENKTDLHALADKLLNGINKGLRKLVESTAANNKNLIIGDKEGNIKSVPAKELLKTLSKP